MPQWAHDMCCPDSPWYSDGLRFSCTECGQCCRVEGHVWVDAEEIRSLARYLGLEIDAFGSRYLRRVGGRLSLVDGKFEDCVFWEDGCTVYGARPRQCRTFPFWDKNMESTASWAETARGCEGIGEGRLYDLREVESLREGRGQTSSTALLVEARAVPAPLAHGGADACPDTD